MLKITQPNQLTGLNLEVLKRATSANGSAENNLMYFVRIFSIKTTLHDRFLNHVQMASAVYGDGKQTDKITKIFSSYGSLFEEEINGLSRKYRLSIEKLKKAQPHFFVDFENAEVLTIQEQMLAALDDEIAASRANRNKQYIYLTRLKREEVVNGLNVYSAVCVSDEDDEVISLPEGLKVKYTDHIKSYVTILEFNSKTDTVIFQSSATLHPASNPRLENNPVFLIESLKSCISDSNILKSHLLSLFERKLENKKLSSISFDALSDLDESQLGAVNQALSQKVTYIWGPPGTGKTHTLTALLSRLAKRKEKTVVCATANVAVDAIALKLVEMLEKEGSDEPLTNGKILRIGYTSNKELVKKAKLFPDTDEIKSLRSRIQRLDDRLEGTYREDNRAKLLAERDQARRELDEKSRAVLLNARIIFCTASRMMLDGVLSGTEIHNLIVDEGSMMSPTVLAALVRNVRVRLIIAGDPRQLGPIALSQTAQSNKWLHQDLFDLLGGKVEGHPAVCMLRTQRRCALPIISLINEPFYGGKLKTLSQPRMDDAKHLEPLNGSNPYVQFIDTSKNKENAAGFSKAQSRYNVENLKKVMQLLMSYLPEEGINSIGIISPYSTQIARYRREIEAFTEQNSPAFTIHAGTIHAFQGQECDVIIFDMVDSRIDVKGRSMPIGRLFWGKTGEQLVNVAISRAIGKLVVIGCARLLLEGEKNGQVNSTVKSIISNVVSTK